MMSPPQRRRPSVGLFTYSTVPRGSVVHTAALADALVDAGCDATVYALDKDGRGFFRPLRARLRLIPAAAAPSTTADLVRLRAQELSHYLARHDPGHDIYHAQDCLTASGLLACRSGGVASSRLTRTVHHVEDFADPYLAACQTASIRQASLCFSVSEAARRDVATTFGVDSIVVGNGVDAARFASPDPARVAAWRLARGAGGPVVLAVGGVEPRKNTVRILQAFARMRTQLRGPFPGARLWILGGATVLDHGAYRAQFEATLSELPADVRAAVQELGIVPEADVPALFRLADVLALPSVHEGFGLAALEALAAGLPVVASDAPPFTEFLDRSCAILVDPRSVDEIARGLIGALRATTSARVRAGRQRAVQHSWQRVAALHVEHYERMMIPHARDAFHRAMA